MKLAVTDIANATDGIFSVEPAQPGLVAQGVTWDSRTVEPGMLYVALPGSRVDGHSFAAAALAAGASCVLAMRGLDPEALACARERGAAVLQVADTQEALARLAGAWRARLAGTVVGITGSVGKTSTKNLVRSVLAYAFPTVATKANQNNELGVPNTLLAAGEDTRAVVVEMGMRGLGQIAGLCSFVRPDWGLVTNVGESHLELLGSRENIARAKAELYEALPDGRGVAFVNAGGDFAAWMCAHARLAERGVRTVYYNVGNGGNAGNGAGAEPQGARTWAEDCQVGPGGCASFTLRAAGFAELGQRAGDAASVHVDLQVPGAQNVENACAAAAVGLVAGMPLSQVARALEAAQAEKGRQDVTRTAAGVTVIDDAYNASPTSMRAALATLAALRVEGRRVAVLGDMGELGAASGQGHRQVGRDAAAAGVDVLVCVGELSRQTAQAAREAGLAQEAVHELSSVQEASALLAGLLQPGDAVLVKASHAMAFEKIVEGLVG